MSNNKEQSKAKDTTKNSSREHRSKASKSSYGERFHNFKEYLVLSRLELRKVSWPTWKETRTTSLVVLGFVIVMSLLLGLVDFALSGAIRLILS